MLPQASSFCGLRIAVAYLGEKSGAGWWDTAFLNPNGFRYLGLAYPKTGPSASLTSAAEAACRAHDERIGMGRVAHLFRLPREIEAKLRREIAALKIADLESICSRDVALSLLDTVAANAKSVAATGPVQVGSLKELAAPAAGSRLAAAYARAFRTDAKIFPYFA